MSRASLPMYDLPEASAATEAFWRGLARQFRRAGVAEVPEALSRRPLLPEHWLAPDLLFSQTCGYPFRRAIKDRVKLVATPCYAAPCTVPPLEAVPTHNTGFIVKGRIAVPNSATAAADKALVPEGTEGER